jgi:hypothetical protein
MTITLQCNGTINIILTLVNRINEQTELAEGRVQWWATIMPFGKLTFHNVRADVKGNRIKNEFHCSFTQNLEPLEQLTN